MKIALKRVRNVKSTTARAVSPEKAASCLRQTAIVGPCVMSEKSDDSVVKSIRLVETSVHATDLVTENGLVGPKSQESKLSRGKQLSCGSEKNTEIAARPAERGVIMAVDMLAVDYS